MSTSEETTEQDENVIKDLDLLGEGGANGEISPENSLVFASLEVCLCLLVCALPALNPTPIVSPVSLARPSQRSPQCGKLVASALQVMENLPCLCSPQGAVAILPTILYLTTGVMREWATKPVTETGVMASAAPVAASLHCLRTLCNHRYCRDERSANSWRKLLTSSLAKVLDLAKTGSDETKLDEVTMLLAIAVFVLHAPIDVVCAPNLLYPCINQFRQCVQSSDLAVRLKCLQTLRSLFGHPSKAVATPYIQALAPRVVEALYTEENRNPRSEMEFAIVIERIQIVDSLIALAEPKNRIQMLALLVPVLVNFLLEGPAYKDAMRLCQSLHERSLQWLMKIGVQYPQEFKALMAQSDDLRVRLETAVRSSQKSATQPRVKAEGPRVTQTQAPTIKLKTDFSNFMGS